VGGAQEVFAQGSINGWADNEWHIQMEEEQRLETQMTYISLYYLTAAHKNSFTIMNILHLTKCNVIKNIQSAGNVQNILKLGTKWRCMAIKCTSCFTAK
jgi:hypothetical protein